MHWWIDLGLHISITVPSIKPEQFSDGAAFSCMTLAYSLKIAGCKNIGSMIADDDGVECKYNWACDYKWAQFCSISPQM